MSKIPLCIISLLAILLVSGCKDDRCSYTPYVGGEVLPDDCYDCQWYAPASAILSDTGYNTVTAVRNRYLCHRETLKEHIGDTLKLAGWLYWGDNELGEWVPNYMSGNIKGTIYLTDREDHLGANQSILVFLGSEPRELFIENYDKMIELKWEITGILRGYENDNVADICCSWEPMLELISFDSY